jgi:ribonuclease HII
LYQQGWQEVAGIDEAGRGPLAGPVVASAVILSREVKIEGLKDSKQLSAKQRETLFDQIYSSAQVAVSWVDERQIDALNILQATRLAMKKAVESLKTRPHFLLIDGPIRLDLSIRARSIIDGDTLSASIAAASIVAKVTRDRLMVKYHEQYPNYGFDQHKGYPTSLHVERLKQFGPSPIHRLSFGPVRNAMQKKA